MAVLVIDLCVVLCCLRLPLRLRLWFGDEMGMDEGTAAAFACAGETRLEVGFGLHETDWPRS
jgi:hypothetical protein